MVWLEIEGINVLRLSTVATDYSHYHTLAMVIRRCLAQLLSRPLCIGQVVRQILQATLNKVESFHFDELVMYILFQPYHLMFLG
jgi:hypothetical protein